MAKGYGGPLLGQISGRAGNVVFVQNRDGSVTVRPYVVPSDPQTPAQLECRANMKRAGEAYGQLTPAQQDQWRLYALAHLTFDPKTGLPKPPRPYNLYSVLAAKVLQVDPNAPLPTLPPTQDFTGDGIRLAAAAGTGTITYTASGANDADIVTELLLQPLASTARTPVLRRYRPAAFVAFTSGSLTHTIDADPGWHAVAVRFVLRTTGQMSPIVEIGKVLVT